MSKKCNYNIFTNICHSSDIHLYYNKIKNDISTKCTKIVDD